MKYRIRIAMICLASGWYGSAFYYGVRLENSAQAAPAPMSASLSPAAEPTSPAPVSLDVTCTFDFPALPVAALEDVNG